ncbi:MAG: tyrosine-type recombinase/integrase [Burkholderiaceae bacterium]|nr:tyrosine-type recombinase/integrase [Burkholderiaceae bacterium]
MAPRTCNYTLTDKKINAAKPREKPYPVADGGGLYLDVLASGSKVWRYSYRIKGKRTKATIGAYPHVSIKAARNAHEAMRDTLAGGIDPARQKQIDKIERVAQAVQAETFETFARLWFVEKMALATERTKKQNLGWMVKDVFPVIGSIPLGAVHASDVLKLLEGMRNTPTKANNIRAIIDRVYQYAAQKLLVTSNPATPMKGLIDKPPATHYPPLKTSEIRGFVDAVRTCGAHHGTKIAVEFLMLTAVRKDNVCKACWEHFDLAAKTWTIPGRTTGANGFMKMPNPHTVYLSTQAMALLEKARYLSGSSKWVFPSVQKLSAPMAEVAINHLFARLRTTGDIPVAFKPHGLRSTASTLMNDQGIAPDVVEAILAHKERNTTRASYNHATYTQAVTDALQWYADRIDKLVAGADVIQLRHA